MTSAATDLSSTVTGFSAAARWAGVTDSDRSAWLEARRNYLTASEMAAVLGADNWKTAFQVFVEKTTPLKPDAAHFMSPAFWGKTLEQPILRAAAGHYGWASYRQGGALLVSRAHPLLAATLDAEVEFDGATCVLEGKTTSFFMRRDWDEDTQELPRRVLIQCQHQLLVSQAPLAIVFCLIGGNKPVKVLVEPDERFHRFMVEKAEWFFDLLARGCPPPVTAGDTDAIEQLYPPENDGSIVRLPIEAREWTERIIAVAEEQKKLKAEDERLRNQIRQIIGGGTYGVLDEPVDGRRYWRWQEQEREGYTVPAGKSRVLSRLVNGPPVDHIWDQLPVGKLKTLEELLAESVAGVNDGEPIASDATARASAELFGEPDHVFGKPLPKRKRSRAKR